MATALSVRIPPEIEQRLVLEVARLKIIKSLYVQGLLHAALGPKKPVELLKQVRSDFGIEPLKKGTPQTDQSQHVKTLIMQHRKPQLLVKRAYEQL